MTRSLSFGIGAALGLVLAGLATTVGQQPAGPARNGYLGRFQSLLVEPNPLRILLLDTATGDLYEADAGDSVPAESPNLQ